ncbi:hypothetical protein A3F37_02950 [Candidatus Saccharibacteria bacterium RIFCSPHIGHO2_12_FULL_41_12]|nr:MAG: hypothetical protein A3F37_02950 [Candidatus Saccharibacteria bacterium RIFCSPHIGHO2_12_FULL_41_12]
MSRVIAIIGGPGTGKTAVIDELQRRGHTVVHEAARQVIDEGLSKGMTIDEIRGDNLQFQMAIIEKKIQNEVQWFDSLDSSKIVFVDRGMHDAWAYFKADRIDMTTEIDSILRKYIYDKVLLLDMLDDYYQTDYARIEDKAEAEELHRLTEQAYKKYGMNVKKIPVMSVEDRVDHIIKHTF